MFHPQGHFIRSGRLMKWPWGTLKGLNLTGGGEGEGA